MYDDGECVVFPSKEMRDWSKFAWKKGDVLVSNDGGTEVIFDKWYDDTYTNFYSKHYLNSEDENNIKYNEAFLCTTERYSRKLMNHLTRWAGKTPFEIRDILSSANKLKRYDL